MNLLTILVVSAACFLVAYRVYGRLLERLLRIDDANPTPAVSMRDDVDHLPIEPRFLLSQHFSAIAAAGPIVGPVLAGVYFGWGPAVLWIVLGSIFIGGVHDLTALVASIRHKARSIAEVVRLYMSVRSYRLFLAFIWIALVYIIVAFTDIVAGSFVGVRTLENGEQIHGGATATASLLYLALPVVMGLLMRTTRMTVTLATAIFLPLVGLAIWAGPHMPLDLAALLGITDSSAVKVWDVLLLAYCLVAGALPVWLLLQPRGHLGGCFLYVTMFGALAGILVGSVQSFFSGGDFGTIHYPALVTWDSARGGALFPMLFITIACGACSGFHCLIASGTTAKQLARESQAKLIGYGAMLMEGMVAVLSLATVMLLTREAAAGKSANLIYALGNAQFLQVLGVPPSFGVSFALLAFTTFVYDTLDVCTRLGRYILQELSGWHGAAGRWVGTAITAAVPLLFVTQKSVDPRGVELPAWQVFWPLFGASNQLMAALALLGVTVWLWRTYRKPWVWFVAGVPAVWMYVMSMWALLTFARNGFFQPGSWTFAGIPTHPVPLVAVLLVGLAVTLLVEAVRVFAAGPPRATGDTRAAVPQPG